MLFIGTPTPIRGCTKGQLRPKGKEGASWGSMASHGLSIWWTSPMLLRTLFRVWGGPGSLWEGAFLTLAVLWLTEALLLIREAVAGAIASFNPPTLPWLVPPNDAAT